MTNYSIKRYELVQRESLLASEGRYHEINDDIIRHLGRVNEESDADHSHDYSDD